MELKLFITFLTAAGIYDVMAMRKAKLKKEIVPYLVLTALTAVFGFVYLRDPMHASFSYFIIKLLGLKGY